MSNLEMFGAGGSYRWSMGRARSLVSDSAGSVRYPSPFFDLGSMYLPASFKTMLRWCRYYFLTNPLINAVVYKMAEYPVTDLVFDSENEKLKKKWEDVFTKVLKFKKFLVEVGLDYGTYGNAFISLHFPFHKYLICKACGYYERANKQKYTFRDYKFVGECNSCHSYGEFKVKDHYIKSVQDIKLIRWNPENITIHHNDATGESKYYYRIPGTLSNDIRMAKRSIIENVPQIFIDALKSNKHLLFSSNNIHHMKRPTIAQKDKGWGLPMILPVLKDTYYLQILRKAQEAVMVEHAVPLRILFPAPGSSTSDPYSSVNLSTWKNTIEREIMRWRQDNNYVPVLPIPVGQETLGGDGKALMLSQEYRVEEEAIMSGMGVPVEFIKGGLSFSGSNVSLRMLENHFLDQKSDHLDLAMFLMEKVGAFMGWQIIPFHFKRFKMADDLQRSAFNLQINQAGKISDEALLEDTDWDSRKEAERISREQKMTLENQRSQALGQASIQGEAQLAMSKYQIKAQKAMAASQADPMMMQEQQKQQTQMQQVTGIPGEASPAAAGQMQIAEQGMMNQAGMIPPMEMDQQGGVPQEAQSQLSMASVRPQMSLQSAINKIVGWLDQLPSHEQQVSLTEMASSNPPLFHLVRGALETRRGAHASSAALPAPQQRPPRRGPEATTAA